MSVHPVRPAAACKWLIPGAVGVLMLFATPVCAQYLDARLVPKGLLRVSAEPHYANYDMRFAFGTANVLDGTAESIGTDLTTDTAGTNVFPTLGPAETAIGSIIRDALYRINVGKFQTVRDADVRRFPFNFAFGLADRLTITASIPIVTTRSQVEFSSDSAEANVGWNLANSALGDDATATRAAAVIDQLTAAIAQVEALIAAGSFGCPTGAACDQARNAVVRAMALLGNLSDMAGMGGTIASVPFAPLANSAAGLAIIAEIAAVTAELEAHGATAITAVYPLPDARLGTEDINRLLTEPGLGFEADSIGFNRQTKLGDLEIGARLGLVTSSAFRAVLTSTVRLPTGKVSSADNFVDIGTGDGQTDLELGLEVAVESPGGVGLSLGGSYARQFSHELVRRVTSPDAPLVPLTRREVVTRDLGDVLQLSAFPTVRLSDAFRVFAMVAYYHKQADDFSLPPSADPALPVDQLEQESEMRRVSFGGGIFYRSDQSTSGRTLPIEAGLNYRSAFMGSGGLTPKTNSMHIYLRLFFQT